jgi:ankyrin repeat protein
MSQTVCFGCGNTEAPFVCSACSSAWYCSAQCQRGDWTVHKAACKSRQKEKIDQGTAFCMAALDGDVEGVLQFIQEGVDLGFIIQTGEYRDCFALHAAADRGNVNVIRCLLTHGANVNQTLRGTNISSLYQAVVGNRHQSVVVLIEGGADVNLASSMGATPLRVAVERRYVDLVKLLIANKKTDINFADKEGCTPVFAASEKGYSDVLTLLLKQGASVKLNKEGGVTPLHAAAYHGQAEAAKLLIEAGIDVYQVDDEDVTALDLAVMKKNVNVETIIRAHMEKFPQKKR